MNSSEVADIHAITSSAMAAVRYASPLRAQQPPALAFPGPLLLGLALVVELLAAGERKLDLGAALFVEIKLERNERHALALDRARELVELAAVQQQPTRALGRMVEAAGLQIFGDVGIDQPELAATGIGVGFADRGLADTERLHLGPGERDAGLEHLADLVVEARLAVVGNDAMLAIRFRRHSRSPETHHAIILFVPSRCRGFPSGAFPA